ncbi:MAG: GtrA family protein [Pseudomonadota bacterium]
MSGQLFRFLATGALATALQYIVLWFGVEMLAWQPVRASGAGYLAGSVLSYVLNYFFTFGSDRSHPETVMKFYVMVAIGWCVNTGSMAFLTQFLHWGVWVSQVLATIITLVWNFLISRHIVFRSN